MILTLIVTLLFLCYVALMLMFRFGWEKQTAVEIPEEFRPKTHVSIIIAARNEEENIVPCLQSILENDYPADLFEVLVVDDFSSDTTFQLAKDTLGAQGKVVRLGDCLQPNDLVQSYKKKAIEVAVAAAQGNLVLCTDADCLVSKNWLKNIVSLYENKNSAFIVAPVNYAETNDRSMLQVFQSMDFMMMQGITAATNYLGWGSMCNGANLAFERQIFEDVNGFDGVDHLASGDDLFLLQKIKKKSPSRIHYLKSTEAVVTTEAQETWGAFFRQRIRWASKNDRYDSVSLTIVLAIVYFFNFGLTVLFFAGFWNVFYFKLCIVLLFGKFLIETVLLLPLARFFGKTQELIYFPLLQPLHILYMVIAGFLGKTGKYEWKGRKVR